ncbi:unnamed protein product [Durusdinium trenchii]|uniref:Uncharacterized protein n=1 Tax=Durusdinium trenchii TaxID=1381693 RepID=A0ABP0SPF6_9DINO
MTPLLSCSTIHPTLPWLFQAFPSELPPKIESKDLGSRGDPCVLTPPLGGLPCPFFRQTGLCGRTSVTVCEHDASRSSAACHSATRCVRSLKSNIMGAAWTWAN